MANDKATAHDPGDEQRVAAEARADGRIAPAGSRAGSIAMIGLVVGVALVSGAIGAAIMDLRRPLPPRVLVLDMASLLDPIANDPALNSYEKRRLTEDLGAALNRAMQAEANEGAIIIDASMVLMAPGSSYVQPF